MAANSSVKGTGKAVVPISDRFWTASNVLSLLRLILVFPIAYLIYVKASPYLILVLALVAILTDWLDGKIARWTGTVSEWGKVLDPLADKVAAGLIGLALVANGALPLWFFALVVARDVLIMIGGLLLLRRLGRVVPSIWIGKVAVFFLALTMLAAVLQADPDVMQVLIRTTTFLLIFSFLVYIRRFVQLWDQTPVFEEVSVLQEAMPGEWQEEQIAVDPGSEEKENKPISED